MEDTLNNNFAMGLFGFFIASMFDPFHKDQIFPELPKIDAKDYENASEEERTEMIKNSLDNDPFWGKFFKKITNKDAEQSLREATKEIDTQIMELNKKRWEIMKDWANKED